jgi:putative component of membrane protein insertase Oxa1/YidC/SpoIIIJ protein YidD
MLEILINVYRKIAFFKHQILFTVFGYSSRCKHIPSCSKNLLIQIKKHGKIIGAIKGFSRILTCF